MSLGVGPDESESGGDAASMTEESAARAVVEEPHEGATCRDLVLPSRYRTLGRIAAGASSDVLRVHDTWRDATLAMKVLRAEYVGHAASRARFLTEANILAALQHPGIVPVHDRGELPDGRLWFTMREIRGRTLRAILDEVQRRKAPDEAGNASANWTFRGLIDAFARMAQVVGYAHRRGVVHRDLKPRNLIVGEHGEGLVMDWGLARQLASTESKEEPEAQVPPASWRDAAEVTRHGEVLGTPAYMPPEQASGARELHGPQSDVYALGAVLYELLSGSPPRGMNGRGVFQRALAAAPSTLREAARDGLKLPGKLVLACERAMRKEIDERYPDADALAEELFAWLQAAR
jgi:eukaryotic-like serine/threonine-protein kinase